MKIRNMLAAGALAAVALVSAPSASAQYWEAANQLQSLISPALSGSGRYKGSVELAGMAGVGSSKLNHVEISTSQGYQYADWFYMGAGLGIDIVRSEGSGTNISGNDDDWNGWNGWSGWGTDRFGHKRTGVMLPIFTDFRFNIPFANLSTSPSMYINLRLGATWLLGNNYIHTSDGWLSNNTNFYFRPSIGVRIPINRSNPRQAVNVGVTYMLITSGNNYWYYNDTQTLSSIGASISFEW